MVDNDKAEVTMIDDTNVDDVNLEKAPTVRVVDNYQVLGLSQEDADFYNSWTPPMRKKLMHKVDRRLIPMLTVLYLISHLDRSNIGNTKIEGIEADLGITGVQWNLLLSLFFIPYIAFEIPSNIFLKRFMRPSLYIGMLVTAWGVVMTCHGVVTNYAGIMCLRLILGALEAGFFPAAVFLTTFWYMPRDLASRISWFYCTSALSGAFSGLLAAALAKMDGVGGYEGWRWIFLMEGIVTVAIGIATFFLLVDTPETAGKWLKQEEVRFLVLQRFIKQGGQFAEGETKATHTWWTDLRAILLNWRLWFINWMSFCQTAMSNATKFNLPTIVKTMGFTNTNAQLMTAPPYVAAAILVIIVSKFSDRVGWRMPFVVGPFTICCIGFSIMLGLRGKFEDQLGASYTACVIAVLGIYASTPSSTSWAAANIAPASRRAVGVAMTIAFGNLGGIMGSYIFMNREAPVYATGFGLSLALGASGVIAAFCAEFAYKWGNAKKARMTEEEVHARYTQDELLKMGEKNPLFKYTL